MADTFADVIRDFERFERNLHFRADETPREILKEIVKEIIRSQSVDTGRFRDTVDFREEGSSSDEMRYVIDTSRNKEVTYDGIVELGRTKFAPYAGRPNYEKGIDNFQLSRVFDDIFNSSFR
jgi:hypothetical protein